MAKQSAVSAVVARIDADLAKWREIEGYVGGFTADVTVKGITSAINERIINLGEMRDYVQSPDTVAAAEKPKRGRTAKRKGLPTDTDSGAPV